MGIKEDYLRRKAARDAKASRSASRKKTTTKKVSTPSTSYSNSRTSSAVAAAEKALRARGITPVTQTGNIKSYTPEEREAVVQKAQTALAKTKVNTNAGSIVSPFQPFSAPTPLPSVGDISNATAGTAGLQSLNQNQQQFFQQQLQREQANQEQQKSSFQSLLSGLTSPSQAREQAQEETGINVEDFFAKQEAKIKEVEVLTNEYNATVQAKDEQIAAAHDKLASNNFINNQIAQIERNAAPKLNRLSADINAKAAVMQAEQGNFAEAQKYVNQAVQDATAENKFKYDMFSLAYDLNQDAFDRVESIYSDAYQSSMAVAQLQYEEQRAEKEQVGELLLDYPTAGIDIYNDSLDEAYQKAGLVPPQTTGSSLKPTAALQEYGFAVQQGYKGTFEEWENRSSGGSGVDGLVVSYLNGDIGFDDVPASSRNLFLEKLQEVEDLKREQQSKIRSNIQSQTPVSSATSQFTGEDAFFNNLFGG